MIRISRVIGLLALLASCRPDVEDCQIRCAQDTELCPDGFSCVEGMCRAEGAEGACGAEDGDAGPDDDAGGSPTALTIETANGVTPGALPFLAVQDGDAAWQELTGAGPHVVELETGRYGVVHACPLGTVHRTSFLHATLEEARRVRAICPEGPTGPGALEVVVEAAPDTPVTVYAAEIGVTGDSPLAIDGLAAAPHDVVATARDTDDTFYGFMFERQVTAAATPAQATVSISDATVPVWAPIEITGLAGDEVQVVTSGNFVSHGGTVTPLEIVGGEYAGVEDGARTGNDVHLVAVLAGGPNGELRLARAMSRPAAGITVPLPDEVDVDAPVIESSSPTLRPSVTIALPSGAIAFGASFLQASAPSQEVAVLVSAGWDEATWTMPDLSALAGWDDAYGLAPVEETTWNAGAWTTTGDLGDLQASAATCDRCRRIPAADWDGRLDAFSGQTGTVGD